MSRADGFIHRIVVYLQDPEAALDWYLRAGFALRRGEAGMYFLGTGPAAREEIGPPEVMLHPAPEAGGRGRPTIYLGVRDLDARFRAVTEAGIRPFDHGAPETPLEAPVVQPWGERTFEIDDPEGQRWGFVEASTRGEER